MRGLKTGLMLACLMSGPALSAQSGGCSGTELGPHNIDRRDADHDPVCGVCHIGAVPGGAMEHEAGTALVASMDAFAVETMDGGLLASGSASIMCLSCHDGAAASEVSPLAAIGGPGGSLPGLGEKDHPVGVPMFGGSLGSGAEIRMAGRLHREANGATVGWWLDLEPVPNGRRDRTDAILYTRGAGAAAEPFVECATCHDPHGAPGTKLLRRPRNGASLCQSCHQI